MNGGKANPRWLAGIGTVVVATIVSCSGAAQQLGRATLQLPVLTAPAWVPEDPLASAYPIPWRWVWSIQAQAERTRRPIWSITQSPTLISPDGRYRAFSRVQVIAQRDYTRTQVSSTLHILSSRGAPPIVLQPVGQPRRPEPGQLWVLVPVSWSADGKQLLVRQVFGWFGSSEISDSALVWQGEGQRARIVTPQAVAHTHALLLGWSREMPTSILFETRILGLERPSRWQVDLDGLTLAVRDEDAPVTYGIAQGTTWTMLDYRPLRH